MVDDKEALIAAEVLGVQVTIGLVTTELYCVVLRSSPYEFSFRRTDNE